MDGTSHVECHGTRTPVGDPIKAEAVSLALDGPSRPKPILIGSIKSNLGHSGAASGISSIINSTLMLENSLIPATVGIRKLNPKIRLKEWNVDVVTELRPFPSLARRRVGVNPFGYGGANAHVVIESAPAKLRSGSVTAGPVYQRSKYLIPLSAFTEESQTLQPGLALEVSSYPTWLQDVTSASPTSRIAASWFPARKDCGRI
ncbi:Beta-ketoacyl synthase, partial [Metarhizium brunneum ARSEF 3297]